MNSTSYQKIKLVFKSTTGDWCGGYYEGDVKRSEQYMVHQNPFRPNSRDAIILDFPRGSVSHGVGKYLDKLTDEQYVGEIWHGFFRGWGTYTQSGYSYVGDWLDNKRNGQGTMQDSDCNNRHGPSHAKYDGGWKDDLYDGHGHLTLTDGSTYIGYWKAGKKHGRGIQEDVTKKRYDGDWVSGKYNGQGSLKLPSGASYVGSWKAGKKDGKGVLILPCGDSYDGEFKDDKKGGIGTYTYANGDRYVGGWKDDVYSGKGTLTSATKDSYSGEWSEGVYSGQGTLKNAEGTVFQGRFELGNKHGTGVSWLPDSTKFSELWAIGQLLRKTVASNSDKAPDLPLLKVHEPQRAKVSECSICFENPVDSAFVPCGHQCACFGCASKCPTCPICRAKVTPLRLFLCGSESG